VSGPHYDGPCKMLQFKAVFLLLVIFFYGVANVAAAQGLFDLPSSTFLQVLKSDEVLLNEKKPIYPFLARAMTWHWLKYTPSLVKRPYSSNCDWQNWPENTDIKTAWSQCDSEFQENSILPSITSPYYTLMIRIDPDQYPLGRQVLFQLPHSTVRGFLALKPGNQPRPLVIFRGGILASAKEFYAERFAFLSLFEQAPFHFLFLESTSGQEFISRNQQLSFAGYEESEQNIFIAEHLQKSSEPIAKKISSVHLAAISLGGHGAFRAALERPELFKSTTLFCPLVSLQNTFDFQRSIPINQMTISYWIKSRLTILPELFPNVSENSGKDLNLDELMKLISSDFLRRRHKDYFAANENWLDLTKIKSPIRIFASEKDPIVPFHLNSGRLENLSLDSKQSSKFDIIRLKESYHCTVPGSYDLYPAARVFKDLILKTSNIKMQKSDLLVLQNDYFKSQAEIDFDWYPIGLNDEGLFEIAVFKGKNNSEYLFLNRYFVNLFIKNYRYFSSKWLSWLPFVNDVQVIKIPLSFTDYEALDVNELRNQAKEGEPKFHLTIEAAVEAAIERWLTQNMILQRRGVSWSMTFTHLAHSL
jgi:pimeloyl-ACP methyl ester carboxylesterase